MKYKNALHQEISEVWKIFTAAQESFLFVQYFNKKSEEVGSPFKSPSFRYIKYVLFKDVVIELHKIYSKGDKTSLEKIKTKIIKRKYNLDINEEAFKVIASQVSINKKIIEKIELNRSKRFAHYEKEVEVEPLSLDDCENLLVSTKKIISTIYKYCFDGDTDFRPVNFDKHWLDKIDLIIKNEYDNRKQLIKNKRN